MNDSLQVFPLITLDGLGTTIGAGIHVLVGEVAGRTALFAPVSPT